LLFYAACKDRGNGDTQESSSPASPAIPIINWSVKSTLPHDTSLFTEGFLVHDGKIFESTGSPDEYADAMNKNPYANVLNGIAYDPAADKIYIVGKRWPRIYQIDFPH